MRTVDFNTHIHTQTHTLFSLSFSRVSICCHLSLFKRVICMLACWMWMWCASEIRQSLIAFHVVRVCKRKVPTYRKYLHLNTKRTENFQSLAKLITFTRSRFITVDEAEYGRTAKIRCHSIFWHRWTAFLFLPSFFHLSFALFQRIWLFCGALCANKVAFFHIFIPYRLPHFSLL